MSFDLDRLVADCRAALGEEQTPRRVRDAVRRAVTAPDTLMRAIGEPRRAGIQTLHRSGELTILNVVWGPSMTIRPHNHRIWAVIGVYTGAEDNIFWRRT